MQRQTKENRVREIDEILRTNTTFILFDHRKMSVAQSVALRKTLRKQDSSLKVVKNRLALRALAPDFPESLKAAFREPTALAYTSADPIRLAKTLKEFSVQNKVLVVKGGLLEGREFAAERFEEITKLSGRTELLGKIGAMMAAPLTAFLRAFRAPLGNLGVLMAQLKDQKQEQA
jgi:large subunit ribosomal protein L10